MNKRITAFLFMLFALAILGATTLACVRDNTLKVVTSEPIILDNSTTATSVPTKTRP